MSRRNISEEEFHDDWASKEQVNLIDVISANEALTAPEMRYITKKILKHGGHTLLDVGCGLGEASVYFAQKGFAVTALDVSQEMLNVTVKLAELYKTSVNTIHTSAEVLQINAQDKFDIIYVGNLFHHVNIETTLLKLKQHLNPDGLLISWDPVAYNPIINIYRRIAADVRTKDEHPLRLSDFKLFRKHFTEVKTKYFWFTTLVIFIIMFLIQRRNPNKERYWKTVVHESSRWAWLYYPLEILDKVLLSLLPPLKLLCWNVVIVSQKVKNNSNES